MCCATRGPGSSSLLEIKVNAIGHFGKSCADDTDIDDKEYS